MRSCLVIGFGLLWMLVSSAHAATSETLIDEGFAGLLVTWPAPVTISLGERGETVEIQASRIFPARIEAQVVALRPLVTSARLNDAGSMLQLHPAPGVRVETAILDDRSIAIGFSSRDVPTLGIRLGRHAGFERIVIEPVAEQRVTLLQDGSRVTLTLPGRLTAGDLDKLKHVAGIERVAAAGNLLFLDLVPGAFLKSLFVGPDRQVLDVYVQAPAAPVAEQSAIRPAPGPPGTTDATRQALAGGPTRTVGGVSTVDPPPLASAPSAEGASRRLARVPAPWTTQHFPTLTIDAVQLNSDTVELRFAWPEPVPAAVFVRGDQLWVAFAAEHAGITVQPERFRPAARRFVATLREESHSGSTLIRLGLVEAPAVDVKREGGLWQIRLTARDVVSGDSPPDPSHLFQPADTGLVLPALDAVALLTDPVVGDHIGIGMALAVTGRTARPARFVGLRLQPASQGAVWQQLGEPLREPYWTTAGLYLGPEEGVTRLTTGQPVPPPRLLETLPMALDPSDEPPEPMLAITTDTASESWADNRKQTDQTPASRQATATGLTLAADEPRVMGEPPAVVGEAGSLRPPEISTESTVVATAAGPLDLARFRAVHGRSFWDQRGRLLPAADPAAREETTQVKLELARLHVANGLGPEAVSLLATIPEPGPLDGPSSEWRALNGAAHFLAARHAAAIDYLGHPALQSDGETALWRGAALAALERWDEALTDWQRGEAWLAGYETVNQAALAEHGIMLLLQTGRIDEAFTLLEQLAAQPLPAASGERLRELEAIALERDGAIEEARTIWRDLASEGSPEARSRALMSLILSDWENGLIEADDAIDRLVADSVHWRGQSDEIAKRRRLASLQQRAGYVEDALSTLQQALTTQPAASLVASVTDDMTAMVEALFDELAAGERSATATLLFYRRFAELIPRGAAGDARIEALARALGELGLDEAAADSLRMRLAQSEVRDAGRAALGHALARILARNGDSRGAIAALIDTTPIDAIDEGLAEARSELFASIGRAGDVMAQGSDPPVPAMLEQARRAFDGEAWPAVIETTASLESELPLAGRLDPASTEMVLMTATASRQLGDYLTVERLVAVYGDRLATATDNATLRLLGGHARFRGAAADVLGDAAGHIRAMREAVASMPPV